MMVKGAQWAVRAGYGVEHDLIRCEEGGFMKDADPHTLSSKAKQRGIPQGGTLGSGNHFLEVQVVREIFDPVAAKAFGLTLGQVCCMIHCGSRGLGHQVCTDHLKTLESATKKYHIAIPDRQLACAPITSPEGIAYFGAMAAAANYAWANRQMITHTTRQVLAKMFRIDYEEMPLIYDVAHNVAKMEEHRPRRKAHEGLCTPKRCNPFIRTRICRYSSRSRNHRSAGNNSRQYGNIFICPQRNTDCDGQDFRQYLPWCRQNNEPHTGKKESQWQGNHGKSLKRGDHCPCTQ